MPSKKQPEIMLIFLKKGLLNNALYQNLVLVPKATAQIAKTILSPVTHMRNLVSAGAFAAANGIIPFLHFNPKMMLKTYKCWM